MSDLTPERIAELRALVAAALKGAPSVIDLEGMHESRVVVGGRVVAVSNCLDEPMSHHCAALAATGWSDLPALLDEVERLRQSLQCIAYRLGEFDAWDMEEPSPDCDPRELDLCEWHNRLLRVDRQRRHIVAFLPDVTGSGRSAAPTGVDRPCARGHGCAASRDRAREAEGGEAMTDNLRPKWMDGPGDDERVDYDLVRDWAWMSDDDLEYGEYLNPHEVRSLARELLRVHEKLGRETMP